MQKLEFLKTILGEQLYDKFIGQVGEKEGAAKLVGMVTKEMETEAATETPAPEPKTETPETPVVDLKALTEALDEKLQPFLADLAGVKQAVEQMKTAQTAETVSLETRLAMVETGVKEATAGVAEMKGEKTRAQSRRASESDKNVTDKEHESPSADPDNAFASFLFGGK